MPTRCQQPSLPLDAPPKLLIDVVSAGVGAAAHPLLPNCEPDELASDTRPKTTKPARGAITKRKPKVAEADNPPFQLSLDA